jgi:phage gpG-like protein
MPADFRIDFGPLEKIVRDLPDVTSDFLDAEAETMVNDVKLSFGTSPAGRSYQRAGVTHIASQPGFPPNADTGTLRAAINWQPDGPLTRTISDGVEYGAFLEFGTVRMGARPFMGPALERLRVGFLDRLSAAVKEVL